MAFAAITVAQDTGLAFRGGWHKRRLGLRLNDGQRVAAGVAIWTLVAIALEARPFLSWRTIIPRTLVIARTLVSWPIVPRTLFTRPIIPWPLIALPISGALISGTLIPRSVVSRPIVSPRAIAAALAAIVIVAISILVARPVVALPLSLSTLSGAIIALLGAVFVARTLAAAIFAHLPGFRRVSGFSRSGVCSFRLGLSAFVFKIDVEAG